MIAALVVAVAETLECRVLAEGWNPRSQHMHQRSVVKRTNVLVGIPRLACVVMILLSASGPNSILWSEEEASDPPETAAAAPPSSAAEKAVEAGSSEASAVYGDAANLQNNREFAVAADEWTKFLEKFPQDPLVPRVHHYRGVCRMQEDALKDAIDDFRTALDGEQLPEELQEEAFLNLGWCHFNLGAAGEAKELVPAVEAFKALLEKFPKTSLADQALFYAGEANYLQGKIPEAIVFYRQLFDKIPSSDRWPDAAYAYGVALQDAGQHDEALQVFDSFLATHGKHELAAEMKLRKGESLLMKQAFVEAEPLFASLVEIPGFPAADHALFRQASCAVAQQKFAEAARLFASLPTKFPKSTYVADAWVSAGNGYFRAENWGEALKAYAEARKARPELTAAMAHWTCRVLLKQGDGAEALKVARAALEKVTDAELKVQLLYDEADALYALPAQRKEALAAYKQLGESHKDNPLAGQALYNAAYAAMDLAEYPQCEDLCAQFLESFPEHELLADVKHLLAESLLRQGKSSEAEGAFGKLIEEFKDHPELNTWQVQAARAQFVAKEYDKVIGTLKPILDKMTSAAAKAEALHLLGECYFSQGKLDAAKTAFAESQAAYPEFRGADLTLLRMASVEKELGNERPARQALQELSQRFPESQVRDRVELLLADLDFQEGKLEEAEQRYAGIATKWPQTEAAFLAQLGQGWILLRKGEFVAAESMFTAVIDSNPSEQAVCDARQARTVTRHRQKKYKEALEDAEFVLSKNPHGPRGDDTRYLLALCQLQTGAKPAALQTLRDMLVSSPDFRRRDLVLYELGWLERESSPQSSVACFRELAEKHPQSPHASEARFHVAEELYVSKQYGKAAELYQELTGEAVRKDIREKSFYKLGWSSYHQKAWGEARKAFENLIRDYPEASLSVDGQFMLGESWFMERKYSEALQAYEALKGKTLPSPASATLWKLHAGQAARQLSKFDEAIAWLSPLAKDLADSNSKWQAKFELGQALRQSNRKLEAKAEFAEVADHRRDSLGAQARFMLGELLFGEQDFDPAIREFQRVMYGFGGDKADASIRPWQAKAGLEAGRCATVLAIKAAQPEAQKEWTEKAQKCFDFVLQHAPASEEAKVARDQLARLKGEEVAEREDSETGK